MSARLFVSAVVGVLCLGSEAFAALDADAKKPYQVTVVLHIAEHRLLTKDFRDRVEREIRDGLQAALGDLAEGAATCDGNLFWRREPPGGAGIAGYRCVKLGAARGPLQLRFVQLNKDGGVGELLSEVAVAVRRHGFGGEKDTLLEMKSGNK